MQSINLITIDNGVGLTRDALLVARALEQLGHNVTYTFIQPKERRRRRSILVQWRVRAQLWRHKRARHPHYKFDVNIMFEHMWPEQLPLAQVNVVIPNPEWFDTNDQRFLFGADYVWAKTKQTQRIFSALGKVTQLIGFDSEDRLDTSIARENKFFHLAGKSPLKGTARLLELWRRHPHWPTLTVIQSRNEHDPSLAAANIDYRTQYLSDADLRTLQNQHAFHLCPSETEGWGHYIVEALSVGAIVVTVDAPPMNELIAPTMGVLVKHSGTGKQRLAPTYRFDENDLARHIDSLLTLPDAKRRQLSESARTWFTENKNGFATRIDAALKQIAVQHPANLHGKEHVDVTRPFKTSLIITTYNWKEALDLTLSSVARQVVMPDEVLVADDGSRPDTAELVRAWAERLPIPVRHIWQEDKGFRLARSRNCAIAAARGDYIVLVDGDMVLNKHFIADHVWAAKRGYFIQGARLLTKPDTGKRMLQEGVRDFGFFAPGIERRRHTIRNRFLSWLVYQRVHTNQKAIRGSNQAYWKDDLLRVNGFNENMVGWGGEDNEIAARLYNIGVKRRNLKFAALTAHIYHRARKPDGENPNHKYLRETIAQRLTRCAHGLDQHLVDAKHAANG